MFWHAPALVHWHGVPPVKSLFFSLVACLRNFWAFTVFGLAWVGVLLWGIVITLSLATVLGSPTGGGGGMVPLSLMMAAMFFLGLLRLPRQLCFVPDPNPETPHDPPRPERTHRTGSSGSSAAASWRPPPGRRPAVARHGPAARQHRRTAGRCAALSRRLRPHAGHPDRRLGRATGPGHPGVRVGNVVQVRQNSRLTVERGLHQCGERAAHDHRRRGQCLGRAPAARSSRHAHAGIRGTGVYTEVFGAERPAAISATATARWTWAPGPDRMTSQADYHQAFWAEVAKAGQVLTPAPAINHGDEELEALARLVGPAHRLAGGRAQGCQDGRGLHGRNKPGRADPQRRLRDPGCGAVVPGRPNRGVFGQVLLPQMLSRWARWRSASAASCPWAGLADVFVRALVPQASSRGAVVVLKGLGQVGRGDFGSCSPAGCGMSALRGSARTARFSSCDSAPFSPSARTALARSPRSAAAVRWGLLPGCRRPGPVAAVAPAVFDVMG